MRPLAAFLCLGLVLAGSGCESRDSRGVQAACFLDPASGREASLQSAFTMPLNVIVLYSPGYHCGACVRGVHNWDRALSGIEGGRLSSHVVVDGTQTSPLAADLLVKAGALKSRVWFDPNGSLRSALGLEESASVVGLSKAGKIVFVVPLEEEFLESEGVKRLLSGITE